MNCELLKEAIHIEPKMIDNKIRAQGKTGPSAPASSSNTSCLFRAPLTFGGTGLSNANALKAMCTYFLTLEQ